MYTDCVSYFVASTYNKENVGRLLRATLHAWSSPQCESQQPLMMNTLTVYTVIFVGANFRGILEMAVRINFRGSKFHGNF